MFYTSTPTEPGSHTMVCMQLDEIRSVKVDSFPSYTQAVLVRDQLEEAAKDPNPEVVGKKLTELGYVVSPDQVTKAHFWMHKPFGSISPEQEALLEKLRTVLTKEEFVLLEDSLRVDDLGFFEKLARIAENL